MSKEKKWEKILSDTYVSTNLSLSEEEATAKLVEAQFAIKQINQEKEDDTQLASAREIVKELGAGYSAASKHEKAKVEFLLEVIEGRRYAKAGVK
ncbi:hypothetical protein UFOVP53_27 [uncultured Caudovirales phage]|uniref:Uncharacterized protein n=1 Tax=uncultured Caudovirales phage TaxID=2100421 RepID=A0A6J5KUD2_9CAUD|nr:hypothetical protein UFOVP53_27 [uncultured Caudovirales phage]